MKLYLDPTKLKLQNISFKQGKQSIKLMYSVSSVYMIGLCFQIKHPTMKISSDGNLRVYISDDNYHQMFQTIQTLIQEKFPGCQRFYHKRFLTLRNKYVNPSNNNLNLSINHLKKEGEQMYVGVYCL
jgi:hypothetical protein